MSEILNPVKNGIKLKLSGHDEWGGRLIFDRPYFSFLIHLEHYGTIIIKCVAKLYPKINRKRKFLFLGRKTEKKFTSIPVTRPVKSYELKTNRN